VEILPVSVNRLIDELSKLPSIGPKTAERLTFYLLKNGNTDDLAAAIEALRRDLTRCEQCRTLSDEAVCWICADRGRDHDLVAVVSQPLDIVAMERAGNFRGVYHVLHGYLSPIDGIGPEDLEIVSLLSRIERDKPTELILATNPNFEGETTALYILKKLDGSEVKVTRLAHGLPVGGDLEYADQVTLGRAIDNRREF